MDLKHEKINIRRLPYIIVAENNKAPVTLNEKGETPLMQVFNAYDGRNIFIYGDGGLGKTATLYSFFVDYSLSRTPDKRACYFVPVCRLQSEVNKEKNQAISVYIGDKYRLREYEFDKKNSLILLDAVNEAEYGLISTKSLLLEICDLMGDGCQFIISGKTSDIPGAELVRHGEDEQSDLVGIENFDMLYCKLCDLKNEQVIPVLQSVNAPVDTTNISQVIKNNQLLSMYVDNIRYHASSDDAPLTANGILCTYMEKTMWSKYLEYISNGKPFTERKVKEVRDDFDNIYNVFSDLCKGIAITKQRIETELKKYNMSQSDLAFFGFLQKVGDNYIWTDENWLCYFAAKVLSDGIKGVDIGGYESFPTDLLNAIVPNRDSRWYYYIINKQLDEGYPMALTMDNSYKIYLIRFEIIFMIIEMLINYDKELLQRAISKSKMQRRKLLRNVQSRYPIFMDFMYFLIMQENLTRLTMPKSFKPKIVESMFFDCFNLKHFIIPHGVLAIGDDAFRNCQNLMSIEIPSSVKSIGDGSFENCRNLTSIELPRRVKSIGGCAFKNCRSLMSIEIPSSVTSVEDETFVNCSRLKNVKLFNGIQSIGMRAFYNCGSLISMKIPDSANIIYDYAFFGCIQLVSITLGDSILFINGNAFQGCTRLTNIDIPNSVVYIGKNAFQDCWSLVSVKIHNSLAEIQSGAFKNCVSLKNIFLPWNISIMGNGVFEHASLTDIYCEADSVPIRWNKEWNYGCNAKVHWGVSREEYEKIVGSK